MLTPDVMNLSYTSRSSHCQFEIEKEFVFMQQARDLKNPSSDNVKNYVSCSSAVEWEDVKRTGAALVGKQPASRRLLRSANSDTDRSCSHDISLTITSYISCWTFRT